eukprot:scaffold2150_cov144-Amphora_coffeaeformis.AAC.2
MNTPSNPWDKGANAIGFITKTRNKSHRMLDSKTKAPDTMVKWKDDPVRELLHKDIIDGTIPPNMKPAQAKLVRIEYKEMDDNGKKVFSSRLASMRAMVAKDGTEKHKKRLKWNRKNPVREQMKSDVVFGVIPDSMDLEIAFKIRKVYGESMDYDLFKSRLASMCSIIEKKQKQAEQDDQDLRHDRINHPRPALNARGEVQWIDSEAKHLLEVDAANGVHMTMSPQEFHLSRAAYK